MADKITLDFENNQIIWDTDTQQGIEYCPELSSRKGKILQAMGFEPWNIAPVLRTFEAMLNGEISEEEAALRLDAFVRE